MSHRTRHAKRSSQQRIHDFLADQYVPVPAMEIARACQLTVDVVFRHLRRLERNGAALCVSPPRPGRDGTPSLWVAMSAEVTP